MNTSSQHAGRRRSLIAAAAGVVLASVGLVVVLLGLHGSEGPPQPPANAGQSASAPAPVSLPGTVVAAGGHAAPTSSVGGSQARGTRATDWGPLLEASAPVGIAIPSIGVRTGNLVNLKLAADGALEVPTDFSSVGWYAAGPSPGQLGPAILAGHVDGQNGPAVFYRLGALRPGALVTIKRQDGRTAKFSVDRVKRFPKDHFPTALVYGSTDRAELRLITCGGSFDPKSGHYVDNIVAFAHLVG